MPRISAEKRCLVIEFSNDGISQKEIAKSLNISRRSVQYIIKKFKETGNVADPREKRKTTHFEQANGKTSRSNLPRDSNVDCKTGTSGVQPNSRCVHQHSKTNSEAAWIIWTGCCSKTILILTPTQKSILVVQPEVELACGQVGKSYFFGRMQVGAAPKPSVIC